MDILGSAASTVRSRGGEGIGPTPRDRQNLPQCYAAPKTSANPRSQAYYSKNAARVSCRGRLKAALTAKLVNAGIEVTPFHLAGSDKLTVRRASLAPGGVQDALGGPGNAVRPPLPRLRRPGPGRSRPKAGRNPPGAPSMARNPAATAAKKRVWRVK